MHLRGIVICGVNLALLAYCGISAPAQSAPEPTAYSADRKTPRLPDSASDDPFRIVRPAQSLNNQPLLLRGK
jgi:hypothetical protein